MIVTANDVLTAAPDVAMSKIPYPAGEYKESEVYVSTAYTTPYVMQDGEYYLLNKDSAQGISPKDDFAAHGNDATWIHLDKFAVMYVEMLIANLGKIGAAVFYEQYMFSQHGTVNGAQTSSYGAPTEAGGNFVPNLLIDFLNGRLKCNDVDVKGAIRATSGEFSGNIKPGLIYNNIYRISGADWVTVQAQSPNNDNGIIAFYIDPNKHPYNTFFCPIANEGSNPYTRIVYLPKASDYPNVELKVFAYLPADHRYNYVSTPRVCVGTELDINSFRTINKIEYPTPGSEVKDTSGGWVRVKTVNDNLLRTGDDEDDYLVNLCINEMYTFLSLNGNWICISGVFAQ